MDSRSILIERSFSKSPKKRNIENGNSNSVDIAISVYEEYLRNYDSKNSDANENINSLIKDLEIPHWKTIIEKIRAIWSRNYENNIKILNNKGEIDNHFDKFDSEIKKIFSKRNEFIKWEKYFTFVINKEIEEIKSERRGGRRRKSGAMNGNENKKKIINSYELKNLIRCHSSNGNPQDDSTFVYDAAFDPLNKNIVATCGGSIINFLDITTGKIVKRFNDVLNYHSTKEKFYCLSWSLIEENSILATAGLHGDIKIMIPNESKCVLRINAHMKQIHCLTYHNKHSNVLFSGSEDSTVQIWGLFDLNSDNPRFGSLGQIKYSTITEGKKLKGPEAVLKLTQYKNYLIISTVLNNYYAELNDDELLDEVDFDNKNPKTYNAKILKFEFGPDIQTNFNTDEFIINKIICVNNDKLVVNLTFSASIFTFKGIIDDNNELKLFCESHIVIGYKCNNLDSSIELFEDNGSFYILKASDDGQFYKIELNKESLALKTPVLKFKIPTDYTIQTKNSSTIIPVKSNQLLDNKNVLIKCVTNVDFILTTSKNNLVSIWSKVNKEI